MYHPLGLNIREAAITQTLPVGGGPDGNDPITVSAGQTIGELSLRHWVLFLQAI